MMSVRDEIEVVHSRIMSCRKCGLWETRTQPVAGEGSVKADIMFIGEAPGFHEDKQGRPFVGRAGKILDELLASVSLRRNDVFIANILKCRPPRNRNPNKSEISACSEYLNQQIDIVQPSVIVALGNFASEFILNKFTLPFSKISKIHGKVFKKETLSGIRYIIPMYHPAVAIYNPTKKSLLLDDMRSINQVRKMIHVPS